MNITIRTRLLRNGNQAIYFDCEDSGRRWQERSGFYLIDGYDAKTKRLNRDAMDKAVDLRSRRILGLEAESPGDKSETTVKGAYFSEWLDGYLEEVRKNPMRNRGYYNNVRATANLVTAYLKKRRRPRMAMKSVNAGFIRGFLRFIKEDYRHHYHGDKPLSDSTIYAHQLRLSQILDHAVRDGVLRSNPLRSLHKRERLRKPSYDRDYLTREELERMGNAACGNDDVKRAYMFCCHSGLRFSDVKALCWKSLRFSKGGGERQTSGGRLQRPHQPHLRDLRHP
ncbi:MAG: site-specific integrase [Bacteroidales bacterium]|nr:site-specific integrase [Bacteroidales bacterium]